MIFALRLLTLIAFKFSVADKLPTVAYLTNLDKCLAAWTFDERRGTVNRGT